MSVQVVKYLHHLSESDSIVLVLSDHNDWSFETRRPSGAQCRSLSATDGLSWLWPPVGRKASARVWVCERMRPKECALCEQWVQRWLNEWIAFIAFSERSNCFDWWDKPRNFHLIQSPLSWPVSDHWLTTAIAAIKSHWLSHRSRHRSDWRRRQSDSKNSVFKWFSLKAIENVWKWVDLCIISVIELKFMTNKSRLWLQLVIECISCRLWPMMCWMRFNGSSDAFAALFQRRRPQS